MPGDWPVGVRRVVAAPLQSDDLESMLLWLQELDVNACISTTPPALIVVAIHDPYGGDDIREDFEPVNGEWPHRQIARWLIKTARFHYPRVRGSQ